MGRTAFIIGAGFGFDAGREVGPMHVEYSLGGPFDFSCNYPLVADLVRICYPERSAEDCDSIEEWFHESLKKHDLKPVRRLCDELMKCDYYLVPRLIAEDGTADTSYQRFFRRFTDADFITFNYDSFVELSLLRMRRWVPTDGYGVPVFAAQMSVKADDIVVPDESKSLVIHLHGSLCVYESHFEYSDIDSAGVRWLREKPEIEYTFDPESLGNLFVPWERVVRPLMGADPIEERVIAPVPDKAEGLKRQFVMEMRNRAEEIIRVADTVIAVGYRFNPVDEESFNSLLAALADRDDATLTVVSPSAEEIVDELSQSYDGVSFHAVPLGFSEWASSEVDFKVVAV